VHGARSNARAGELRRKRAASHLATPFYAKIMDRGGLANCPNAVRLDAAPRRDMADAVQRFLRALGRLLFGRVFGMGSCAAAL